MDGITDLMEMSLSKPLELVTDNLSFFLRARLGILGAGLRKRKMEVKHRETWQTPERKIAGFEGEADFSVRLLLP